MDACVCMNITPQKEISSVTSTLSMVGWLLGTHSSVELVARYTQLSGAGC